MACLTEVELIESSSRVHRYKEVKLPYSNEQNLKSRGFEIDRLLKYFYPETPRWVNERPRVLYKHVAIEIDRLRDEYGLRTECAICILAKLINRSSGAILQGTRMIRKEWHVEVTDQLIEKLSNEYYPEKPDWINEDLITRNGHLAEGYDRLVNKIGLEPRYAKEILLRLVGLGWDSIKNIINRHKRLQRIVDNVDDI